MSIIETVIKSKVYLVAEKDNWATSEIPGYRIRISAFNPLDFDNPTEIVISEIEVDFPICVDVSDLTLKTINLMRGAQERLLAETQVKVNNIEEQIQQLLYLPNLE